MAEHHGKVGYVTADIKNLAQLTGPLRKAGAENPRFAGATYHNPFLAAWLLGDAGQKTAKDSAPLIEAQNAAIPQVYSAAGFTMADVAEAFSSDDFNTRVDTPGYGKVPANVAKVCQLTWACTKQDPHANAAGHKVFVGAFAAGPPQSSTPQQPGRGGSPTPSATALPDKPGGPGKSGNGQGTGTGKPQADGNLAEAGSSGDTPVLAGIALATVAVGAEMLLLMRKRRAKKQV
jgi:hypothetical protein